MNIEITYRYRDWGNFKKYGAVIFANQKNLSLDEVRRHVLRDAPGEQTFVASQLRLPELFFLDPPFDADLDHGLHEFFEALETTEPPNDLSSRDISVLLMEIEASSPDRVG